uniref:Uncharacterized protein n=1 Tax=Trichogramma kaykai TaxID=54128 RepID=A0ABD2XC72_9HYME
MTRGSVDRRSMTSQPPPRVVQKVAVAAAAVQSTRADGHLEYIEPCVHRPSGSYEIRGTISKSDFLMCARP